MENTLYYGDNLDILRRYIKDESVDLVYLDPPFNSNATYNVLFAEHNGTQAAAQIKAFEDTWEWNLDAMRSFEETIENGGRVAQALLAFRQLFGDTNMLAYLSMMAPRLVELRRVLKETGSIYLHCDPTASHYLKILLDSVFGAINFKNEINWKRSTPHGTAKRKYGVSCDVILFYTVGSQYTWHPQRTHLRPEYIKRYYSQTDSDGRRFQPTSLLGHRGVNPEFEWHGITKSWRYPPQRLDQLEKNGMLYWPPSGGVPRFKRYLDENAGQPILSLWDDIPPVNSQAKERLGYPTQKPEALLERIVEASSNEGDLVLDPFCGCGTTIAVAQRINRRWIGIDITHLAIALMRHRLKDTFGSNISYKVVGEPVSLPDAEELAHEDAFQFQWWALGLVGARPVEQKKGADKGIDGRIYFHDEGTGGKTKQIIFSVKAGHTSPAHIRELCGVVDREKAQIGVLLILQEPTGPMRSEAASSGFYESPGWGKKYPRIQILTVRELLEGASIDMPPLSEVDMTFKKAQKAKGKQDVQHEFLLPP